VEAFRNDPADYYPGINALTLGRLREHITGRQSKLDLPLITAGVRWAVDCAVSREKTYWALVTRAELAIAEGTRDPALDDYSEAAAIAVANRDRFALDSSGQTLKLLQTLGFRLEIVTEAADIIHAAEQQLDALIGARSEQDKEPTQVVLFSGHMVDKRDRPTLRFPEEKADAAAKCIAQEQERKESISRNM
jgi:hypothetical protein